MITKDELKSLTYNELKELETVLWDIRWNIEDLRVRDIVIELIIEVTELIKEHEKELEYKKMKIDINKALKEFEKIDLRRVKELREGGREIEELKNKIDNLERRIDELLRRHYLFLCEK